ADEDRVLPPDSKILTGGCHLAEPLGIADVIGHEVRIHVGVPNSGLVTDSAEGQRGVFPRPSRPPGNGRLPRTPGSTGALFPRPFRPLQSGRTPFLGPTGRRTCAQGENLGARSGGRRRCLSDPSWAWPTRAGVIR